MNARTATATALTFLAIAAPAAQAAHTTIPSDHDGVAQSSPKLTPAMRDVRQGRCPSKSAACTSPCTTPPPGRWSATRSDDRQYGGGRGARGSRSSAVDLVLARRLSVLPGSVCSVRNDAELV